jgi:Tat protein translocase TatC
VADDPARGDMPFLDHLEELRWRVLYSLLAIVVATLAGWFIVERVDVIGLLIRPIAPLLPGGKLKFTSPTEPFFITLKLAFAVGLLLASPVVVYQLWAFLAPALYERERRLVIPALSVGVLLFLAGASAAYFWVLPRALQVLFSFQQNVLEPIITAGNYFGFAAQIIIAFGLMTELPLVVVILAALGLVTPQVLARNRRYAVVLSAVAAALLSPPDAVSMVLMMVPLWLLYEVSIVCAWIVTKRGTRPGRATAGLTLLCLIGVGTAGGVSAQGVPPAQDTAARGPAPPGAPIQGQRMDTATARKLGLPTGPTRSFAAGDAVMDSLLRLKGFRVTQYAADTLLVTGDSQTIFLRGQAFLDREGTKLEADSVRYREASCRLDASGDPKLFEHGTVMVGESMRYDTCLRRGTVRQAFTDFRQGGATWYMRGNLAVDSGSIRLYGASTDITSDDHAVPDYHFATGQAKWLSKSVMVARPAVLYIHDVPILWLPFIFQDVRPGRRSGMLSPRLGVNDLVRPTRSYQRHFANLGYFVAINDYLDVLASVDWYAGRNVTARAQSRYRWLDRFIDGSLTYSRVNALDSPVSSSQIGWQHVQSFDSRTRFNASVNYATSGTVLQQNSVDPFLATASLASQLNFDKRFGWGTVNIGGSRSQDLSGGQVSQTFPRVSLTPSPVNITPSITWSPGFSYTNQQTFHSAETLLPVVGTAGVVDTLALFAHTRQTSIGFQTPLRVGRWSWDNSVTVNAGISNQRQAFDIPDSTAPGGRRRVLYVSTFSTTVDWQTGINLPQLFSGSWKLQPGIQIVNATSAGPFMLRNQFSGGQWVQQSKRPQFSVGIRPAFFGFFPGLGPVARIRHSISPIIDYRYALGGGVDPAFARVLDPTGTTLNARTDPQQTISIGLSQNFEAKLRPARGDTSQAPPRKLRLLSINTDGIAYNFEQAKQPGRVGWQTQTVGNTFASDLLPNFSFRMAHDLWDGPVGLQTSRFSPFLQSVNASFAVTQATLRGLGGLLGLRHHGGPASIPPLGTPDQPGTSQPPPSVFGGPRSVVGPPGGGQGFSLNLSLTINRTRPATPLPTPVPLLSQVGQQQLNMNLSFQPTDKWQASWTTAYDLVSHQFGEHYVRLERDLHRWRAIFSFAKSSNGNFAFSFSVSLLDEPDIKFDYEQQTLQR